MTFAEFDERVASGSNEALLKSLEEKKNDGQYFQNNDPPTNSINKLPLIHGLN